MAISAATGSAAGFISAQLRVQQAERNADQAEASARVLRRAASNAQREADSAQESARMLKVRSDQAQSNAGLARQQVTSMTQLQSVQQGFEAIRTQVADSLSSLDAAAAPTVNAEGQTTGVLLNVTA